MCRFDSHRSRSCAVFDLASRNPRLTRYGRLQRQQQRSTKDAYDLAYCLEHVPTAQIVERIGQALETQFAQMILKQRKVIKIRFCSDPETEGFRKDGPRKAAQFELGDGSNPDLEAARLLRQHDIAAAAQDLIKGLGL